MKSPGEWAADPRIDGIRRWYLRYQPFLITVVAIALIAAFLPGRSSTPGEQTAASDIAPDSPAAVSAPKAIKDTTPTGTKATANIGRTVDTKVLTFEEAKKKGVLVANCDQATGNIQMPTRFAPPCVQKYVGPNGGNTYQGVNAKTIKVVYMIVRGDPASDAILTAAGVNDSDEAIEKQVREWGQMYESHVNMWGRKIQWVFETPSGDPSDDAVGKADAIKVATQHKAFASIGAPNNTYVNELVARGVMCFCTTSQPIEAYIKWYPYVWTSLLASSQGYLHRAAYAGGRLANRNAQWANDEDFPGQTFKTKKRVFGFIYYETEDYAYKSGAEFFIKYMKEKYRVNITPDRVASYLGYPDHTVDSQTAARPIIQKMKQAGVTSILCSCDPFAPIFFTQEATKQLYGPEWVVTGSALTDTSFFGRLYDKQQWKHAFGVSYLPARLPEEIDEPMRLYKWQFNKEPSAPGVYGVVLLGVRNFFTAVHMAGPVVTPKTMAAGLERLPIRGKGGITTIAQSFGDKGLWPWKIDPVAYDDATEIWWDPDAEGEDEIGQPCRGSGPQRYCGLYRYVAMGKRYFYAQWPRTNPFVFNKTNTATIYEKPPKGDQWPCYTSPATKQKNRC